jgi:hypothetical protein
VTSLKSKMSLSVVAMLLGTTSVYAQANTTETRSLNASTSTALSADTGFLTGGQVQVQGTGQGSAILGRTTTGATITANSGAVASLGTNNIPATSSSMITTFDFDRSVEASGALVGVGSLVSQGESIGGSGVLGTASAEAEFAGTRTIGTAPNEVDQAGNARSTTGAQGSLVGSFSTTNTIQMLGQENLFAGSQALDISERNTGVSAGVTGTIGATATEINLAGITTNLVAGSVGVSSGQGSVFATQSTLGNNVIDMNVANAGGGSILVTGSTGGFFGQGTVAGATGGVEFGEVGGFFTNP